MSTANEIHCYEYVSRPYEVVSEALVVDPLGLFQRATHGAAGRADALLSKLKLRVAGFELGKNVVIRVKHITAEGRAPGHMSAEATRLSIEWEAETQKAFFPAMRAELLVYPLSAEETQLDLIGAYEPPGGLVGAAADRLVGQRIAKATMHRFLDDLAQGLGTELPEK